MSAVKRIASFLIELVAEALLLGVLLGAMASPRIGLLNGIIGSIMAVPVILGLHGYYVSRILAGIARTSKVKSLYPAIAASVFIAHVLIIIWRSKSDLSPATKAVSLPFLIGGHV
jgi:hypothetical protein